MVIRHPKHRRRGSCSWMNSRICNASSRKAATWRSNGNFELYRAGNFLSASQAAASARVVRSGRMSGRGALNACAKALVKKLLVLARARRPPPSSLRSPPTRSGSPRLGVAEAATRACPASCFVACRRSLHLRLHWQGDSASITRHARSLARISPRRAGRVADGGGLENRYPEPAELAIFRLNSARHAR